MDDKTLADALVADGIGQALQPNLPKSEQLYYYAPDGWPHEPNDPEDFVRDPRVAMACMERMGGLVWRQEYKDDTPVWIVETDIENIDATNESLPRAICEAYVMAKNK